MENEEWIQAENSRQLEQLSLEDLEEEETTAETEAQSPPVPPLPQEQVHLCISRINLFTMQCGI